MHVNLHIQKNSLNTTKVSLVKDMHYITQCFIHKTACTCKMLQKPAKLLEPFANFCKFLQHSFYFILFYFTYVSGITVNCFSAFQLKSTVLLEQLETKTCMETSQLQDAKHLPLNRLFYDQRNSMEAVLPRVVFKT